MALKWNYIDEIYTCTIENLLPQKQMDALIANQDWSSVDPKGLESI